MGTIKIGGVTVTGNNIQILNGRVIVDGVEISGVNNTNGVSIASGGTLEIRVLEGRVENLQADGSIYCGDIGGSASAGGSINCGDVDGKVSAGGSVNCGDVGGNVSAGGSVKYTQVAPVQKKHPCDENCLAGCTSYMNEGYGDPNCQEEQERTGRGR